jgi:hypothetical protein
VVAEAEVEAAAEVEASGLVTLLLIVAITLLVAVVVFAIAELPEAVLLDKAPREEEEFRCLELIKRY